MTSSAEDLIHLGDIKSTHGLKGTLVIYSYTRPEVAIGEYRHFRVGNLSDQTKEYSVLRCWQHGKRILLNLEGIGSVEQATGLIGQKIFAPRDSVDVDEDEYLWHDLIGCQVWSDQNEHMGEVIELQYFGAQDNLLVQGQWQGQQGQWLIPFIEDIVLVVDLDDKRIDLALPDGMEACFTPKF